jgi:flagellar motility protein MotE (MotC chaperone)
MSRMITFLSIAVVLFSVAAGASWYLQSLQHPEGEQAKTSDEKTGAKAKAEAHTPKGGTPADPANRTLTRPAASPEADKLAKAAGDFQQKQESLKAREQQLGVREKQLDTIHDEIKKEHKKLESIRKEIEGELAVLQEKLDLYEKRSSTVDKTKRETEARIDEFEQKLTKIKPLELKNTKQAAGIHERMEPEVAAQSIQQMVERGELEFAVAILANMRERQAAAVMTELTKQEAATSAEIMKRMRYYKALEASPK